MLGVNSEWINQLLADVGSITDARLRDMVLFAVKCSRNPKSLDESDFEGLRAHGLMQSHIVEIIAMSALAVYANIIADATGMDEDEMFSSL
jgi:alkylhydroperoxidase family enzyme